MGIARRLGGSAALLVVFAAGLRADTLAPCPALPATQQTVAHGRDQPARQGLVVASLNIAARAEIVDALATWTEQRDIDVLLLQEVGHPSPSEEGFTALLGRRLGFHSAYAPAYSSDEPPRQGLAIVSRYPLVDVRVDSLTHYRLRFRSRCRIALGATVVARDGPVSVLNVHLDTRVNSKARMAQLAPVLEARNEVALPQILGGDFNTMNVRWIASTWPLPYLQRQAAAVHVMLAAAGFDTPLAAGPPTFRIFGIPLHLDWLYLKALEPLSWGVDKVPVTDHRGVWVRVATTADRSLTSTGTR